MCRSVKIWSPLPTEQTRGLNAIRRSGQWRRMLHTETLPMSSELWFIEMRPARLNAFRHIRAS